MVLALVLLPALSDLLGGKRDVDPSGFGLASWLAPGVSFALGAFFAGMILAESLLSHRAAEETLPLRDAFAVLFVVSVGMLFGERHTACDHEP